MERFLVVEPVHILGFCVSLQYCGEVNASGISPDTAIGIQTGSGDINLSYKTAPANLAFGIASGSKDITAHFDQATYVIETTECRQGTIGNGAHALIANSDSSTIVIK